jgi:hypothetical protein
MRVILQSVVSLSFVVAGVAHPARAHTTQVVAPRAGARLAVTEGLQKRPTNCEDISLFISDVANAAREDHESYVILIARLGDRERNNELNRRRLQVMANRLRANHPDLLSLTKVA